MYRRYYYLRRRKHFLKQRKEFYDSHKERYAKYNKKYREENDLELRKKHKIYYEENRDKILKQKAQYIRIKKQGNVRPYKAMKNKKVFELQKELIIKYYPILTSKQIIAKFPEEFKNTSAGSISQRALKLRIKSTEKKRLKINEIRSKVHKGKPKSIKHKEKLSQIIKIWWSNPNNNSTIENMKELWSKQRSGKNNFFYKDGNGKLPYPNGWGSLLNKNIRQRDKCCAICNISNQKCREKYGRVLDVHHIDRDKNNLDEINLICLCRICHSKIQPIQDDLQHQFLVKTMRII